MRADILHVLPAANEKSNNRAHFASSRRVPSAGKPYRTCRRYLGRHGYCAVQVIRIGLVMPTIFPHFECLRSFQAMDQCPKKLVAILGRQQPFSVVTLF
jgi:hypothetical protein